MDDKEIVLKLIDYFIPEASDDEVFMQYLIERLDSYFDYSFLEQMRDSLKWRVIDCVQKTREDYAFMTDTTHHVYLDSKKKEIHFGEYVLPAYWYKEEMPKKKWRKHCSGTNSYGRSWIMEKSTFHCSRIGVLCLHGESSTASHYCAGWKRTWKREQKKMH
jgi:hypothetical protein